MSLAQWHFSSYSTLSHFVNLFIYQCSITSPPLFTKLRNYRMREKKNHVITSLDTVEFLDTHVYKQPTLTKQWNLDFFAAHLQKDTKASISGLKFPNDLKEADIIPVYKKKSKLSKENYRPSSILPNISKVYERCLYDQLSKYFEARFSKFQCGFCKGYSAQHCLLAMVEKQKAAVGNGGVFVALLTDLSKAFDCIPHDLIIAKQQHMVLILMF